MTRGQGDSVSAAVKQPAAGRDLQRRHLARDGRLRVTEGVGRGRERAGLRDLAHRVAAPFAHAAESGLDAVDALVAEWRQAVHDGQLALAPQFDPAFYRELVQFGTVLPWTSGVPVAHSATS